MPLYHGAAYYPELWPPTAQAEDLRQMRDVGINVVRMGEFAWAAMEPEPDRYDFGLFIDVIARLHAAGIATIFCTPTPTPPIWYSHGHPERMKVNEQGQLMCHGSRQHCCQNHPDFRLRSRLITEAVARAIGRLPGVAGWQTDNEIRSHMEACYCPACRARWHRWLEARYGTIERLNAAWGTGVWSETYQAFAQVPLPLPTPSLHHASLLTNFRRFSRAMAEEFQHEQVEILRRHSPAPITHNSHRWFHLDNETFFRDLDFPSFDIYASCDNWPELICNYDLWRNVKPSRAFWVMETSPAHNGSLWNYERPHPPGYLAAEAAAAYASGAQGFCYWLWRQQRSGSEITHGSVLSAWGRPAVGYESVRAVGAARDRLEPWLAATAPAPAEVALTCSDQARAFFLTEPHFGDYLALTGAWHAQLLALGLHRDLLFEGAALEGRRLLLTPFVPYLPPAFLARAEAFVRAGGTWLVGPITGCRTEEHTVPTDAPLGALEALAGVEAVFLYPMKETGATGTAFSRTAPLGGWSAVFAVRDAQAMGTIDGGLTPGLAFLTERAVGAGRVVMLGAQPQGDDGTALLRAILAHYADAAGVTLRLRTSPGTLAIPRRGEAGIDWAAVNMDGAGGTAELPEAATDLLSGETRPAGAWEIGAYGYRVLHPIPAPTANMLE